MRGSGAPAGLQGLLVYGDGCLQDDARASYPLYRGLNDTDLGKSSCVERTALSLAAYEME